MRRPQTGDPRVSKQILSEIYTLWIFIAGLLLKGTGRVSYYHNFLNIYLAPPFRDSVQIDYSRNLNPSVKVDLRLEPSNFPTRVYTGEEPNPSSRFVHV